MMHRPMACCVNHPNGASYMDQHSTAIRSFAGLAGASLASGPIGQTGRKCAAWKEFNGFRAAVNSI